MKNLITIMTISACIACSPQKQPQEDIVSSLEGGNSTKTFEVDYYESRVSKSEIIFEHRKNRKDRWWNTSNIYQIWVRSFSDSNGDGSGDIAGITEKLGYIASLNVNAILLSPIFKSPSYHGYDVTDFYSIESSLGSIEDLELLISRAGELGIKVLLDLPLNHTSDQHPWFQKALSKSGQFEDYYIWAKNLPAGYGLPWDDRVNPEAVWHSKNSRNDYFYGVFGYSNPDLNYANQDVVSEVKLVLAQWINAGIKGFRIDAARYLLENGPNEAADSQSNHKLLQELISYAKSIDDDVLFIGETFMSMRDSGVYFGNGENEFDALFNFEFYSSVRELFQKRSLEEGVAHQKHTISIKDAIFDIYARISHYTPIGKDFFVFLSNHDIRRFTPPQKSDFAAQKILAAITVLSPFNFTIYYGEEIGMPQIDSWEHEYSRGLMHWSEAPNHGFTQADVTPWMNNEDWFPWKKINSLPYRKWATDTGTHNRGFSVQNQINSKTSLLAFYQAINKLKLDDAVLKKIEKLTVLPSQSDVWFVLLSNELGSRLLAINLNTDNFVNLEIPTFIKGRYRELLSNTQFDLEQIISLSPGQTLLFSNN